MSPSPGSSPGSEIIARLNRSSSIAGKGSKWIRRETRVAIYMRDSLTCVYCGIHMISGVKFSLDHLYKEGGNGPQNLVTACQRCNSLKGGMHHGMFAGRYFPMLSLNRLHQSLSPNAFPAFDFYRKQARIVIKQHGSVARWVSVTKALMEAR